MKLPPIYITQNKTIPKFKKKKVALQIDLSASAEAETNKMRL